MDTSQQQESSQIKKFSCPGAPLVLRLFDNDTPLCRVFGFILDITCFLIPVLLLASVL